MNRATKGGLKGPGLEHGKMWFKTLIESTEDIIAVHNQDGTCLYHNGRGPLVQGAGSVIGKTLPEAFDPEFARQVMDEVRQVADTGKGLTSEIFTRHRGRDLWFLSRRSPVLDSRGRLIAVSSVVKDITDRKKAEKALRESEERLRLLLLSTDDIVAMQDLEGRYMYYNSAGRRGLSQEDFVGKTPGELFEAEFAETVMKQVRQVVETRQGLTAEEFIRFRHVEIWLLVRRSPVFDEQGNMVAISTFAKNITERKLMEDGLRRQLAFEELIASISTGFINRQPDTFDEGIHDALERLGTFLKAERATVYRMSRDGKAADLTHEWCVDGLNPHAHPVTSIAVDEVFPWIARRVKNMEPIEICQVSDLPEEAAAERHMWETEGIRSFLCVPIVFRKESLGALVLTSPNGEEAWSGSLPLLRLVSEVFANTFQRKRSEEELMAALSEKEMLLKEVHHRVKNNLAVISGLLFLKSRTTTDPEVLEALSDSGNRVRSIALIHETLYRSQTLGRVNMQEYFESLARQLVLSYQRAPAGIDVRVQAKDAAFAVDTAIPCGLIVNELISNAIKHAFPDGMRGAISVTLTPSSGGGYTLTVADNGVGLPDGLDFRNSPSLGLKLVCALASQIDATVDCAQAGGVIFTLTIPEPVADDPQFAG